MADAFTPDSADIPTHTLTDADLAEVASHVHVAIQATARQVGVPGTSGTVTAPGSPTPGSPTAAHTFGLGISDLLTAQDLIELRTMGTDSLTVLRDVAAKDLQILTKVLVGAVERKLGIPLFGG